MVLRVSPGADARGMEGPKATEAAGSARRASFLSMGDIRDGEETGQVRAREFVGAVRAKNFVFSKR